MTEGPPRRLDGYDFVRVIGKGNFGQALLVREVTGDRRELVIKQIAVGGMNEREEAEAMREVCTEEDCVRCCGRTL